MGSCSFYGRLRFGEKGINTIFRKDVFTVIKTINKKDVPIKFLSELSTDFNENDIWILKIYNLQNEKIDKNRINLIKENGPKLTLPTFIDCKDKIYKIYQPKVSHIPIGNFHNLNENFKIFLSQLQFLHNKGLIHGDLSFSNLRKSLKDKIYIFDWEPVLHTNLNKKKYLRTTPYCISPFDLAQKKITFRSDRFALTSLYFIGLYDIRIAYQIIMDKNIKLIIDNFVEKYLNQNIHEYYDNLLLKKNIDDLSN